MKCSELLDFLSDYVHEELPYEQRALFEEHLVDCSPCVRYLDSYRKTIHMGRMAYNEAEEPMPPELIAAILDSRRAGCNTTTPR